MSGADSRSRVRRESIDPVVDEPRRRFLCRTLLAAPALICVAQSVRAADPGPRNRSLVFLNTHTRESLALEYCHAGQYRPEALDRLNLLLRDHRSGEVGGIDPRLFDDLHELARRAGTEPRFEVISAFRSASSNAALRARSTGVAQHSLHMQGKAMDVRLTGFRTRRLQDLALDLARGGVGYYARSDFVHIDTGRVRSWIG